MKRLEGVQKQKEAARHVNSNTTSDGLKQQSTAGTKHQEEEQTGVYSWINDQVQYWLGSNQSRDTEGNVLVPLQKDTVTDCRTIQPSTSDVDVVAADEKVSLAVQRADAIRKASVGTSILALAVIIRMAIFKI